MRLQSRHQPGMQEFFILKRFLLSFTVSHSCMFVGDADILHFKDICFILSFAVSHGCMFVADIRPVRDHISGELSV